MKSKINTPTGRIAQLGVLLFALFGFAQGAQAAGTAANTTLTNTVSVAYNNNAGTLGGGAGLTATSFASITVELVEAAPTIAVNGSTTINDASEGEDITIDYQITSTANGPDDYAITLTESLTTVTSSTFAPTSPVSVTDLGATNVGVQLDLGDNTTSNCVFNDTETLAFNGPTPATCAIDVPNDIGTAGNLNGLQAGEVVLLTGLTGGTATDLYCTVDSVSEPSTDGLPYLPGQGTTPATVNSVDFASSIVNVRDCGTTLDTRLGTDDTFTAAVGTDILETTEVTVTVTVGGLGGAASGSTDVTASVDIDGGVTVPDTALVTINVVGANLTIIKYVRNQGEVQTPAGSPDSLVLDGVTYYRTGITAAPGEKLEYAVVLLNQGGAVIDLIATDDIVPFTTFDSGFDTEQVIGTVTTPGDCPATCDFDTITVTAAAVENDVTATTITVYAGTGGSTTTNTGGTLSAGESAVILYRLDVAN